MYRAFVVLVQDFDVAFFIVCILLFTILTENGEYGLYDLLPIGSKTFAKVCRPHGCKGCTSKQTRSVRKGTLKPMSCVKSVSCSLPIMNHCNNSETDP